MSKTVVLTGLRANNDLHLGNYFGALLPIVEMATKKAGDFQINLFVPDLHSFTTAIDHRELYEQTMHNLKIFAAAGLDYTNQDIFLYRQSFIPAHSELAWILECFTGIGEMSRMTQFKDKSKANYNQTTESDPGPNNGQVNPVASVGLFNYPVLMAADILLYNATYVPVGEDQTQHLEFTRDIALRMNRRFYELTKSDLFVVPKPTNEQLAFFGSNDRLRIRDLQDPKQKMSKSNSSDKGVIFLGDDPDIAHRKVMSATTDSLGLIRYDFATQPGISNLLQILALLKQTPQVEINKEWENKTNYAELKNVVADCIKQLLTSFREKLSQVNEEELDKSINRSEVAMNLTANETLLKVQRAVGLRQ